MTFALRPLTARPRRAAAVAVLAAGPALAGCGTEGTGLGVNLVPEQQIEQMAAQSWQQIQADTRATNNRAYRQRAEQVSNRLLQAAGYSPGQWEVRVFQGDAINAFALPNGKIGVYEGMMTFVDSDDQLAAVIAHEIAHVEEKHSQERVNSQVATQTGVEIAGGLLGASGVGGAQQIAAILGAGAQYGVLLPYSRNQELEADREGLGIMRRAGYDPSAAVALWRKMERQGGAQPPAFMSTHPAPGQRAEQLETMIGR